MRGSLSGGLQMSDQTALAAAIFVGVYGFVTVLWLSTTAWWTDYPAYYSSETWRGCKWLWRQFSSVRFRAIVFGHPGWIATVAATSVVPAEQVCAVASRPRWFCSRCGQSWIGDRKCEICGAAALPEVEL